MTIQAERFSRYEIGEELGQGGMAAVYRAYDPLFEREVALKILKRELLNDPQERERFERETRIITKLEHAAIVPVYDVGRDADQLFFVMRYMSGGSLADRLQNRSLSLSDIGHVILRVASALDYAHNKGIIHRDLKPGNILFDEYNNAYISDFGIAKLSHAATKLNNPGIIGTPTHMSPEQALGEDVDRRSDIYSLGVIVFEMLSGKTPFDATTPLGMAFKHATYPIPHIREINPSLPAEIEPVIEKVLAKDRNQRYGSATEFANAFIATLPQPLTVNADLVTPPPPPLKTRAEVIPSPARTVTRQKNPRARLWMFAGATGLVLTAFVIWGYSQISTPVTPTPAPATSTPIPFTPTSLPTGTATALPTETAAPAANDDIYLMNMDGSHIR